MCSEDHLQEHYQVLPPTHHDTIVINFTYPHAKITQYIVNYSYFKVIF